jgi:hypothetical protein
LKGQYFSWPFFWCEIQTNQESTRVLAGFSITYPTLLSSLDTWSILSLKLYFLHLRNEIPSKNVAADQLLLNHGENII